MKNEIINIIIAEDSEHFLEGLKIVLKRYSKYKIIDVCRNGQELLESPVLNAADLIITDIEMPVMNGLEAARRINSQRSTICMIAITMHIESVFLNDLIMVGFKGFVYKPDVSLQLHSTIELVLSNQFVFPQNLKIN